VSSRVKRSDLNAPAGVHFVAKNASRDDTG
jgi:hypothetical protein